VITLATPEDTRHLGERLAAVVRAGDLIVLDGQLGAGKTVLVQGLAAGLGAAGAVTSPTFVIARVHRGGRLTLVHVDAYRLGGIREVDDLDLDTDLTEAVVAVEWGTGLVEGLSDAYLRVELTRTEGLREAGGDERVARLHAVGGDWAQRLVAAQLPVGS
jgi:tRNA threonylcarbamoyladenosine biosynthesis protein TsaE